MFFRSDRVLDAFGTANALAEMTGISSLRFRMKVVGLRASITGAWPEHAGDCGGCAQTPPDAVVMPAHPPHEAGAAAALAGSEVREAGEMLRKWSGRGALTATACIGTAVARGGGFA